MRDDDDASWWEVAAVGLLALGCCMAVMTVLLFVVAICAAR